MILYLLVLLFGRTVWRETYFQATPSNASERPVKGSVRIVNCRRDCRVRPMSGGGVAHAVSRCGVGCTVCGGDRLRIKRSMGF